MSDCCNDPACNRIKPMLLMRDPTALTWYVVTSYAERENGQVIPYQKHALPEDAQNMLHDMFYAQFFLLSACTALETSPKGIMERLGLDPTKLYGESVVNDPKNITVKFYPEQNDH